MAMSSKYGAIGALSMTLSEPLSSLDRQWTIIVAIVTIGAIFTILE
jgi:hypothetical protein